MDNKQENKRPTQKFIGLPPEIYEALSALAEMHKRTRGNELDYLIGFYRSQMGDDERVQLDAMIERVTA